MPRLYRVNVVHGYWNESEISWNNQPWIGFECSSVKIGTTSGWVSFDVTMAVRGYVNKWYPVEGFVIQDQNEGDGKGPFSVEFASREYTDESLRPILNVTVSYDPDFQIAAWPDTQTIYAGGSVDFWSDVRSVNLFEGDISMKVSGLDPTMSANIQPKSFHLGPGEVRGVRITVNTLPETPAQTCTITITGTDGGFQHNATVRLEVKPALFLRDLPRSAANDTDITVTLRYNQDIMDATGLVIEEWLPKYVNYTSHQLPSNLEVAGFTKKTYDDGRTLLKWVLANKTGFSTFKLNYTAHFAFPVGQWIGNLWFWGSYRAIDSSGMDRWDNILGDNQLEVSFGLPGSWDDDGKVNDWELLQAISMWVDGGLTDLELLAYIDLWSSTWWQ